MSNLIPFQFEAREIRVITHEDGSLSLVAKDVADSLEYTRFDSNLLSHVPDEWKGTNPIRTPGGIQEMLTLTEQGLYFFLNRSDKPKALPFQKWLAGEVLPSIRKTGSYSIPNAKPQIIKPTGEERGRLMLAREAYKTAKLFGFAENMAVLSAENFVRNTTGVGVLVSMGAVHLLADPKGRTYTVTEIGKLLSPPKSAIATNLLFEAAGLQTKEFDQWLPTDKAQGLFEWLDTGKRHSNGTPVKQIKWFSTVLDAVKPQVREAA